MWQIRSQCLVYLILLNHDDMTFRMRKVNHAFQEGGTEEDATFLGKMKLSQATRDRISPIRIELQFANYQIAAAVPLYSLCFSVLYLKVGLLHV